MKLYTNTDVANMAVGFTGSSVRITNIETDPSNTANIIRRHFDSAIDTVVSKNAWKVYSKRLPLGLIQEFPDGTWNYSYSIPSDCGIIRRIASKGMFLPLNEKISDMEMFQIFFDSVHGGFVIHTNVPYAHAEYTIRVPFEGPFMSNFAKALAAQLALDIAPSLITNNYFKIKETLKRDLRNEISEAIAQDICLSPEQNYSDSPFISVR